MDSTFTMPPAPSPTKDSTLFKGIPIEARVTRRMSALPPRTTALGRSSTLKINSSATLVDPNASVPAHMLTFPDDERARRRRRRHSEHPTNAPPRRSSPTEQLPSKRPDTADSSLPSGPAPQRPQRHPTLHLHDVDEMLTPKEARPRRWADTPGAASVAAWVADQQVQSQFQFAPIPPTPTAATSKQSGLLGKVKKLVSKK